MATPNQIREVAKHYLIACIWADCPDGTHPRATHAAHRAAFDICKSFIDLYPAAFDATMQSKGYGSHPDAGSAEAAFGHDLYLSSAGHGCGFFDRDELPEFWRECLQDAARDFGEPYPEFYRGWLYLRGPQ